MKTEEEIKIDQFGWKYYESVPDSFSGARIEDFYINGRKIIGHEFLIKWVDRKYYQVCIVTERLTGLFLYPFIQEKRVFIKNKN